LAPNAEAPNAGVVAGDALPKAGLPKAELPNAGAAPKAGAAPNAGAAPKAELVAGFAPPKAEGVVLVLGTANGFEVGTAAGVIAMAVFRP
jgi:hypothetical protein